MAKSGLIPAKPQSSSAAANDWVSGATTTATAQTRKGSTEDTTRLTFDVPKSLHRRVMLDCAINGVKMATVLRQMIEERWPADEKQ